MKKHYTIATGVKVSNYNLYFEPDFKTFKFNAQAIITMNVKRATRKIRLNSKELTIKSATVICAGQKQNATVEYMKSNEEIAINLKEKVSGKIKITIKYGGIHNDKLYGFYRSKYNQNGKTKYLLTTQFESPNARAAFPCIDEPDAKATFKVSMLIDDNLEALSNMQIKQTKKHGKKKLVSFYPTPKMSTYLLYLGVGKYDSVEGSVGKIKMSVKVPKGSGKFTKLPFDYGKKLFKDLQNYFEFPYPLPKLDLIGIPDFAAGAMENWGAITFRETALLGNKNTSVSGKQRIAEVVAHEMVHQWFGDLVTMKWWNDLWLNESFATFIAYRCVDRVFPDWKMMLKYYNDTLGTALVADGLKNTHPISVDVQTVGEVEEIFDAISYNKGGSVLLMLEDFVRPEIFRKGLVRYLKKNAYSNATKKDLWKAIETECRLNGDKRPIVKIMEDWVNREGYPIVNVKRKGNASFELTQERFTISGNMSGVWRIPITYLSENGPGKVVVDKKKMILKNTGSWIKLNYGQSGFYRVNYQKDNLNALGKLIKNKKLNGLDIWGIENDLFALVRCGKKSINDYINFVKNFCMDSEYPANVNISRHLSWMTTIAHDKPFVNEVKKLSLLFHRKIIKKLGWERTGKKSGAENSVDTQLRSSSIIELTKLGDKTAIRKQRLLFNAFRNGKSIDPNLRMVAFFSTAYNYPSKKRLKEFISIYNDEKSSPEERIIALRAIGSLGDKKLLEDALDLSLSDKVRLQDSYIIPIVIASLNPTGKNIYKKWAIKNWKTFMKVYSPSSHMLRTYVSTFGMLSDSKSKSEFESFFKKKQNIRDDIKLTVKQVIERISANIKFVKRNS